MSAEIQTASPKPERTFLYRLARGLASLLGHTFFPVRYHGLENFSLDAPYILIANHKSWMDPLFIALPCKKYEIRFVGKKELAKSKIGAWTLNQLHMITIDRHNTDLAAMRQCVRVLREGWVLGTFPEGTRHLPDLMSEVETGTAVLALRAKVPLLPVFIDRKVSFLRRTNVYVGPPMDISDLCAQGVNAETIEQLTQRIRDTFFAMRDDSRKA